MQGRSAAHRLADRILNGLAFGLMKVIDDTALQQTAQLNLNPGSPVAETIDHVPRLGEYGIWSCPPDGAECVTVFLGGRRNAGVIVATGYRAARIKNLKPGEAVFANVLGGQTLKAAQDGDFYSVAPTWHHAGDQNVTGTVFAGHVKPADGWTGTFATGDSRTVHVTNGIITSVA